MLSLFRISCGMSCKKFSRETISLGEITGKEEKSESHLLLFRHGTPVRMSTESAIK